jgi:transposase
VSNTRDGSGRWRPGSSGNLAGRPPLLTEKLIDQIAQRLRKGATLSMAATLSGIYPQLLHAWLRRGAAERDLAVDETIIDANPAPPSVYAELHAAAERAIDEFRMELLAGIAEAGATWWQARAWILERRWPREYGRFSRDNEEQTEIRRLATHYAEIEGLDPHEIEADALQMLRTIRRGELPPPQ